MKDKNNWTLGTGMLAVAFFWVSVGLFVGEITAPFWAGENFTQRIWPRVSVTLWFLVGPGLTAAMAMVFFLSVRSNCRGRKVLAVLGFIGGYVIAALSGLLKASLIYANTA